MQRFEAHSSNTCSIKTVCSDLGFSNELSKSELNKFKRSLQKFRIAFERRGGVIPALSAKGPCAEAEDCALEFCEENNRGEALWPITKESEGQISWFKNRDQILRGVSQILVMQAINRARASGVGRMGNNLSAQDKIEAACIKEIKSLNPALDKRPFKEFTSIWLSANAAEWPKMAITRLKYLMHLHNCYDMSTNDQILKIIDPLRKGTPIERCDAQEYTDFEDGVRERMGINILEFIDKRLIETDVDGTFQKSSVFNDIWKARRVHWATEPDVDANASVSVLSQQRDIFIIPDDKNDKDYVDPYRAEGSKSKSRSNRDPSTSGPSTQRAKRIPSRATHPQHDAPSSSSKPETPKAHRSKFRARVSDCEDEENVLPPQKKQKQGTTSPSVAFGKSSMQDVSSNYTREILETSIIDQMAIDDLYTQDSLQPEVEKNISTKIGEVPEPTIHDSDSEMDPEQIMNKSKHYFPELSTPVIFDHSTDKIQTAPAQPVVLTPPSSSSKRPAAVTTPQIVQPTVTSPSKATPVVQPPSLYPTLPNPEAPTPSRLSINTPSAATEIPSHPRQHLVLVLENTHRNFIFEDSNTLSPVHLRDASVFEFFDLYSEKSKAAHDTLTCLTFTFLFAESKDEIIVQRGDKEQWKTLKSLAHVLFSLNKKRKPTMVEFLVTIEIGDKSVVDEEEDIWGR